MIGPYVDVSRFHATKEFSLHALSKDHLVVIYASVKQFKKLSSEDVNKMTGDLSDLNSTDMELLFDLLRIERAAEQLEKILHEMSD